MLSSRWPLIAIILSSVALAKPPKPTLTYRPSGADATERPVITSVYVGLKDSDYTLRLEFDKEPWGPSCGMRCANATLFIDTDNHRDTGLKLRDKSAAENGADLVVLIQGVTELQGDGAVDLLRARLRRIADQDSDVEAGALVAEYDHRRNQERLVAEGTSVYILVDSNIGNLPAGSKMRVVYHPLGAQAVSGFASGISARGGGNVEVFMGSEPRPGPRKPSKKPKTPPKEVYAPY